MVLDAVRLSQRLAQFTGSATRYKHMLGLRYTEGVQYLAEQGQCRWLLDEIANYQNQPVIQADVSLQEFQLWVLTVEGNEGQLCCYPDSPDVCKPVITQPISHTDFVLPELQLCVEDGVLLLPSEH